MAVACPSVPSTAGCTRSTGSSCRVRSALDGQVAGASAAAARICKRSSISEMVCGGTPMAALGTTVTGRSWTSLPCAISVADARPASCLHARISITIRRTTGGAISPRYVSAATCCTIPTSIAGDVGATPFASGRSATCFLGCTRVSSSARVGALAALSDLHEWQMPACYARATSSSCSHSPGTGRSASRRSAMARQVVTPPQSATSARAPMRSATNNGAPLPYWRSTARAQAQSSRSEIMISQALDRRLARVLA